MMGLPIPVKDKKGDLYTSIANFMRPEDCPRPSEYCTVTREGVRSPFTKFQWISKASLNCRSSLDNSYRQGWTKFHKNTGPLYNDKLQNTFHR